MSKFITEERDFEVISRPEQKAGFDPNQARNPDGTWGSGGSPTKLEDKPCFKSWFGDSKVVDADGKPLTVYHGSPVENIDVFEPTLKSSDGFGSWFSSNQDNADSFGKTTYWDDDLSEWTTKPSNIYKVYLSIKNPWELQGDKGFDEYIRIFKFKTSVSHESQATKEDVKKFRDYLKDRGKDGVIIKGMTEAKGADYYVALDPNQIKSIDAPSFCDETNIYKSKKIK